LAAALLLAAADATPSAAALLLASAGATPGAAAPQSAGNDQRLSLVLIGLDTFRADHLGCYGNREVRTPELDALARESVLFENCYANATWTLPSYATLLTGLMPHEHSLIGGEYQTLARDHLTLAQLLRSAGWFTRAIVAVDWLTRAFNLERGFVKHEAHVDSPVSGRLRIYQRRVVDFVSHPRARPYFLFAHYFDTHDPYDPPAPWARMYYAGDPRDPANTSLAVIHGPRNRVEHTVEQRYRWLDGITDLQYAAGVTFLDHHIGEVIAAMRASGELDRAIVVVTADHGEHLTEHDIYFTHRYPYEENLHVPLLIRLPGAEHGGRRVSELVALLDVLPTLLELLQVQAPYPLEGRSLVPLLRGSALPAAKGTLAGLHFAEYGADVPGYTKAVWNARWRLIRFVEPDSTWVELYDRQVDRAETRNLAGEHSDVVAELQAALDRRFPTSSPLSSAGAPAEAAPLDAEALERLRALGYIK
jgi:arylsulfatase A-like enzyme